MIEDLPPANGKRGGKWNDHLKTLNGILWIPHTGAQWRELLEQYGKWRSVHDRLSRGPRPQKRGGPRLAPDGSTPGAGGC